MKIYFIEFGKPDKLRKVLANKTQRDLIEKANAEWKSMGAIWKEKEIDVHDELGEGFLLEFASYPPEFNSFL